MSPVDSLIQTFKLTTNKMFLEIQTLNAQNFQKRFIFIPGDVLEQELKYLLKAQKTTTKKYIYNFRPFPTFSQVIGSIDTKCVNPF